MEGIVQVIKLKSGESIIGIVGHIDAQQSYIHLPALIDNNQLTDYMPYSKSLGFVLESEKAFYIEEPTEHANSLYSEYFIDICVPKDQLIKSY